VDLSKASLIRELLTGTELAQRTSSFAHSMRRYTTRSSGLLLIGPADDEPWHLTAHLDDELHRTGLDDLRPSLVRWSPPPDAPAHLRIGLERLTDAGKGESLLVVSENDPAPALLERIDDVRRRGATVFSIDNGDKELASLSHESLVPELLVPAAFGDLGDAADAVVDREPIVGFEMTQHLVSLAVADDNTSPEDWRARFRRFIERVGGGTGD
jgi:hypothetical protein